LLGYLGVHRFYVGRIASGILWMFTGGLLGVGWVIDIIQIANGTFRDSDGLPVLDWD
jgi:TM2 domain-containing membrane protein YozV